MAHLVPANVKAQMMPLRQHFDSDGIPKRRSAAKGTFGRHIQVETTIGGQEYGYHATKGWRSRRVPV